jgi:NAD(P)-dependent dehydrogenase (short-subunit alcohol dehydrogenase family)
VTTSRAVLITGCSTGIGRATALLLGAKGWSVYATARRPETLDELAAAGCTTMALDVTDDASMVAAVQRVEAEAGAIGVLVNNAGYGQEGPVEEVPIDDLRRQFETNVFGAVRLTQLALPGMRSQGWGRIVNMSSMGGRLTFPGGGAYHASKYALEALSDALRFEVRPFGVHVVLIEPGAIKTEFADTAVASIEAAASAGPYRSFNIGLAKRVTSAYEGPMGRLAAGPEAVADVVEKAITAKHPRARYSVTAGAKLAIGARRLLPDRAWDAIMRSQFPSPTP